MAEVLVTGAAGFLGGALARAAEASGHRVMRLGHGLPAGGQDAIAGPVGPATLARLPRRPEVVVHCAGGGSVQASLSDPAADHARTVGATQALVDWAAAAAPGLRIVYPSSGAVYGAAAGTPAGRTAAGPHAPLSPYGRHKAEAEAVLTRAARDGVARVAILRLFSVYGPGLRKQLLWDACRKFALGAAEFHGTGAERRDFVEVGDVAALMLRAADAACTGQPFLADGGTGAGVEVRAILRRLAACFAPPPGVRFLGDPRAGDPAHMVADPAAALALGWRPQVTLDDGLARYVRWFQSQPADG
jgi:UDP-glucose 4-epimerase